MATQTLCVDDGEEFDSTEEDEQVDDAWGRMFPLNNALQSLDLVQEKYIFGRGDECDVQFTLDQMKDKYQALSKKHFSLSRESTSTGTFPFLIDLSSNGTFVNGEKVGKGNKQVLHNNDEISLAMKKNRAFIFMDLKTKDEASYPEELTSKYTMSRLLGRGACGEVKLAFTKGTCKSFAVKIVNKKKFTVGGKNQTNLGSSVMGEVKILKDLNHPCIIKIEDVIDTPDALYIVLELVEGGELFDRVVSVGQFDEPTAKLLFYQMTVAIKYLHDQGITHRDLKPENILLASDATETVIKVTDFGLSKFVDAGTMMKTFCGTPNYLAPEILLTHGSGSYTDKIDCWSLGVILYICLVGYPPFTDEREDMDLQKQILGGHYDFPPKYWSGVSPQAIDLVKKLLQVDPRKRISLSEALQHPWFDDEESQAKANKLMYGTEQPNMLPPKKSAPPKRKLKSGAGGEPSPKK